MYSAVGSMTDMMTQLRSQLSAASTGSATETTSVISSAQDMLKSMASLLNTQYDGQYVFAGGKTETAPVDLSSYASGTGSTTTADTSYYAGDERDRGGAGRHRPHGVYGVTADNSAFEQVMRALRFVANSRSLSSSDISSALDARRDGARIRSRPCRRSCRIAPHRRSRTPAPGQSDYKSYAETLSGDLTDVDVAAVTAQLSTYQSQLTASYSAIGKILSLNLASYLS